MAQQRTCPRCGQIVPPSPPRPGEGHCLSCRHQMEGPNNPWALPVALPVESAEPPPVRAGTGASGQPYPAGQDGLPLAFWSAQLRIGLTTQYGFLILRPHYVAFVATTGRSNLAADLTTNVLGLDTIDFEGLFKYRSYFEQRRLLRRVGLEKLDSLVRAEVKRSEGMIWAPRR